MSYIKNLQQKSHKEKSKIMWIAIIIFGVVVLLGWLILAPKDYLKEGNKTLGDMQKEFNESDSNKKFDEYMNSLGILNSFEDGFEIDEIINEIDKTKTKYNEASLEDVGQYDWAEEENVQTPRLPLEKDIEIETNIEENTN